MTAMTPTLIDAMRGITALLRAGSFRSAQEQLETIIAANPDFVEALRLLGGVRPALRGAPGAETLLRRPLQLDPTWPRPLATLGELLLPGGRSSEAEPLLQRA